MKRILFFLLVLFSYSIHPSECYIPSGIKTSLGDTVFVSLGSICHSAQSLKSSGYRLASYPLDWVTSVDGEKIIQLLEKRFAYFLDRNSLVVGHDGLLRQSYYHIIFAHEGVWFDGDYSRKMPEFKERFRRRIKRFLDLKDHKGTVCFLRNAWENSDDFVGVPFRDKENIVITDEYSIRLKKAIRKCFPDLNFYLFILNPPHSVQCARKIDDNVFIVNQYSGIDQIFEAVDLCF